MKTALVGALGMLALQVVLVGAYLVVDSQDPIILDPESGSLEEAASLWSCSAGKATHPKAGVAKC